MRKGIIDINKCVGGVFEYERLNTTRNYYFIETR